MKIRESYRRWLEEYRVFRFYFRKYRKYYLFGIFSLVVVDGLEAFPPLLLMLAVNSVTEQSWGPELKFTLLKIVVAYLLIALVQGLMRFLWRRFIIRTSMFASHDMRQELFIHLSSLAPGFFQKKRVGDLVSLATNDIEAVRFSLGPGALILFDCLFYFLAIPPLMLWISPQLTLIAFLPLLVVPFFVKKMEALIQSRFREVQDLFGQLASHCQESMSGIRLIKGASLEDAKEKEFGKIGQNYLRANLASAKTQASLTVGLEGILSAASTILFLMGGAYVIGEKISLGVFVAFQRYIGKMQWPMEGIGMAANIFQRSLASQKRVDEVLQENPFRSPDLPQKISSMVPAIEVRALSLRYRNAPNMALQEINLSIKPGMRLGITGGIGSGKSTLLACLARMIPIEREKIFFSGVDVCDLALEDVRKRVAFVPQESFLFSRTVEENILYGSDLFLQENESSRQELALKAASHAAVRGDIENLPSGLSTLLGEKGTNLSGGQRQRLTIARAVARAPQILLLDDCLSAVDAETEKKLIEGIQLAAKDITLVLASHRISTLMGMDWLVMMEGGRIIDQGNPQEVVHRQKSLQINKQEQEREQWDLLR